MTLQDCIDLNVDFNDMNTGYLFHIQDYNRSKRFGLPVNGIRVTIIGTTEIVGYYDPITKKWVGGCDED